MEKKKTEVIRKKKKEPLDTKISPEKRKIKKRKKAKKPPTSE